MIRLSKEFDIEGIIKLWNEAFGDSEKDIKFFLSAHYIPENAVVCEIDGIIVSVLFLIDGEMHIKGNDYPSYYLYAACTLNEFRGRGIMSEMLEFARSVSEKRNKYFIALKPGEDSLYGYYSKFGYKPAFSKKVAEIVINRQEKNENSEFNTGFDFVKLRDCALVFFDYFKWNEKSIDFAVKHHKYYGGRAIFNRKGYALYSVENDFFRVKETTFTSISDLKYILDSENLDSITIQVELPYNSDTENYKFKTISSGMLLPLNKDAEKLSLTLNNAYLALTLD